MSDPRDSDDLRLRIAANVADGKPVDWEAMEAAATDEDQRAWLRRLRGIASIASTHNAAETAPPVRWGSLQILEEVGQGSFGYVYRAWDPRLDREVALKLLKQDRRVVLHQDEAIEEARLMARIRHPNVVTIYGAERIDGRTGIWMEFVHGSTLEEDIRRGQRMDPFDAARVGAALCDALAAVHGAGLVHQDVKPQNIMREANGRLVLMDFGTGLPHDSDSSASPPGGTPLYIAPEVLAGAAPSARSDIYSAGVVLYRLITGIFPISGRSLAEIRQKHGTDRRVPVGELCPACPRAIAAAIDRATEAGAQHRFESAEAFSVALKSAVSAAAGGRRHGALVAFAIVILGLVTAAVFVKRNEAKESAGGLALRQFDPDTPVCCGGPSPDGKWYAYTESGDVMVRPIAGEATRRLTENGSWERASGEASSVVFSGDSSRIAYAWSVFKDGGTELRVIGVAGGPYRIVRKVAAPDSLRIQAWTRDGKWIAATTGSSNNAAVSLIDADSGEVKELRRVGRYFPRAMSFSPDGRFLVYDLQSGRSRMRDVFMRDLQKGVDSTLVDDPANDAYPVFTADGRSVVFWSDRTDTIGVWRIAVSESGAAGEPELLIRDVSRGALIGTTASGDQYYSRLGGLVDVYVAGLSDDLSRVVAAPRVVSPLAVGQNIAPDWSHDGHLLAFARLRQNRIESPRSLVVRNLQDDTEREHQVPQLGFFTHPKLSPSGRWALLKGTAEDQWGLQLFDLNAGRFVRAVRAGNFNKFDWAEDDSAVVYMPGRREIRRRSVTTGREEVLIKTPWQISEMSVDPTRRRVLLSGADERQSLLAVADLSPGAAAKVIRTAPAAEGLEAAGWSTESTRVFYVRQTQPHPELWSIGVDGKDPRPTGIAMRGLRDVRVHPDGRRIAFTGGFIQNTVWVIPGVARVR